MKSALSIEIQTLIFKSKFRKSANPTTKPNAFGSEENRYLQRLFLQRSLRLMQF